MSTTSSTISSNQNHTFQLYQTIKSSNQARPMSDPYQSRPYVQGKIIVFLILMAGDIQPNPGPIRYPCGICGNPVAKNHKAMGCEDCDTWFHIKCCGISPQQYTQYQSQSVCNWICPHCSLPNFSNSFFADDSARESTSSEDDMETQHQTDTQRDGNNSHRLKIIAINVNSIRSQTKKGMFHVFIDEYKPDIIIANETEIGEDITDSELLPDEYQSIRKSKGNQDRGVMIAHKKNLIITLHCICESFICNNTGFSI